MGQLEQRLRDIEAFTAWLEAQPRTPGLLRVAALRWLDTTTEEHVNAQRLAQANQAAHRRLADDGPGVLDTFARIVHIFAPPGAPPAETLYIRSVFNAVGSVLLVTGPADAAPADIIAAARRMVISLTDE
ncbi:hypothetical protein [Catenuloplanes japonicus]|uniref:hypothetical protein n=1 Tax=Catenuloplanes japonicus TaxID=33876 RepID=UPI000691A41A|nr:hypothetical protein [Catenuloplanes japonicus]